jgi:hypothetical protein
MIALFFLPPFGAIIWPDCVPCSAIMSHDLYYLLYVAVIGIAVGSIAGYVHAHSEKEQTDKPTGPGQN